MSVPAAASISQAKKTVFDLSDMVQGVVDIPRNINEATKRLSTGTFTLRLAHGDIDKIERRIDGAGYRILLGMVLASIIVGLSTTTFMTGNWSNEYLGATIGIYIVSIMVAIISAFYLLKNK